MTYSTLGHTYIVIFIVVNKYEYNPPNKYMELESSYLL